MIGLAFLICLPLVKVGGEVCADGHSNYSRTEYPITKTVVKNVTTMKGDLVTSCCPGFVNKSGTCEEGCKERFYGENCTSNCSCPSFCDEITGDCLCEAGTHGDNCSKGCDVSHYGINCKHECMCENNSTCNHIDGSCNCTSPGWRGDYCNEECTNDTYGLFCSEPCQCNDNQTCDSVNGSCTCKSGWEGNNCTQECADMTYGVNCKENCTCNSAYTERCDKGTGFCHCRPGYTDVDCSKACPFGWFGKDCANNCSSNCTYTKYCDHENGTCICLGRQGPNCTKECDVGKYGPDCTLNCNCSNSLNKSCHNMSGQCECLPGWTGQACDRNCDVGKYGPDCTLNCSCINSPNESCQNTTGQCECMPGWTGRTCDTTVPKNETFKEKGSSFLISSVFLLYIILPVIGLLLVLTVILVAIYWRRRTVRKRLQKERTSLEFSAQANPGYNACDAENIPLKNGSSDSTQHLYEDAVMETENQRNPDNNAHQTEDPDNKTKYLDHTYTESKESEPIENEYSLADEESKTGEHRDENVKDRPESKQEELYDTTKGSDSAMEDIRNEYNTFENVRKIYKDASKKDSEIEEDYDVIASAGSMKKKVQDMENYSSFEQVRKLSLQDGNEEDEYNMLNEAQPKHRSAPVNDSSYHHISLKDKTIDGEIITSLTATKSNRKQYTPFIARSDSINEESEDEEKMINEMSEVRKLDEKHENHEESINEVIYDECDLDDDTEELKLETSVTDMKSDVKIDTIEVVYEECDTFDEDELRPPSRGEYEDVSDEEKEVKEDRKNIKPTDNSCRSENEAGLHLKKRSERRREDYEEFDL